MDRASSSRYALRTSWSLPSKKRRSGLQYITVDDCDEALARAKQNGATVVAEPVDAPPGRFAILRDPIGGMIGVIKPASVSPPRSSLALEFASAISEKVEHVSPRGAHA